MSPPPPPPPPSLSPLREGLTGGAFEREAEGEGDGELFGVSDVTPGRGAGLGTIFPFIPPGVGRTTVPPEVKTDCRGDNISEDEGANIDSRGERDGEVGEVTGTDEGGGEGDEAGESTGVLLKPGED